MSTRTSLGQAHFDEKVAALEEWAKENCSFEKIARMFAFNKVFADELDYRLQGNSADQRVARHLSGLRTMTAGGLMTQDEAKPWAELILELLNHAANTEKKLEQKRASARGAAAANALHNRPGSSRDKRAAIQALWATGKYSSRDMCAEQECAALEMAFGTARKALRNTPEPLRRCAA